MSFLLRFPSSRQPTGFSPAELKGIWRFVRRGYVRDRVREYVIRTALLLLVVGGLGFCLFSALT